MDVTSGFVFAETNACEDSGMYLPVPVPVPVPLSTRLLLLLLPR